MPRDASALLLEALDSLISHYCLDKMNSEMAEGYTSTLKVAWNRKAKTIADSSCPLARLMSSDYKVPIHQETVDVIKERISEWGTSSFFSSPQNPFFLMMADAQTERTYQEMKARKAEGNRCVEIQNSTVLATKTSTAFQWQNLSSIGVKDLKLFQSCKGKVLTGTLITVPSVIKGITTFLKDDEGSAIQIALYNFVPGKMSRLNATEYARKHLPKGTRVSIAEPFMKILVDGNRGVRIDDPREFRTEGDNQSDISTAREDGNEFYKQKMYYAASESYITGLKNEDLVPTLLSNRAQAHIKLEQWPEALVDAAASLTIRPTCEKTYQRYMKALAEIEAEQPSKRNMLHLALDPSKWQNHEPNIANAGSASGLKQAGNEAYKCQDYECAITRYTSALNVAGKVVRVVLSNWSQSSLQCDSYHEALAASAAALRIWVDGKAVYRLCVALAQLNELGLAISLLDSYDTSTASLKELKSSLKYYSKIRDGAANDNGAALLTSKPFKSFCPDFASDMVETFLHPVRGRGIRAVGAMPKGSLILIETPLSSSYTDAKEEASISYTMNQDRTLNDKSQSLMESTIMQQTKRNQLLARRIGNLYDGQASQPLLPLKDLLNSIEVANAPLLLPPWPEFFDKDLTSAALSAERVRNIMSINSFGNVDDTKFQKGTSLFASISMFNHSFSPNCVIMEYSGSARAILTCRAVKKGEEMCISYHSDRDVVKRKWGIE